MVVTHQGVDQLETASCKDYGGYRFKHWLNHKPMVAGCMGL